jgi:hypothetical protein
MAEYNEGCMTQKEQENLDRLKRIFAKLGTDNTAEGDAYREMRDRTYREAKATRAECRPSKKSFLQKLLGQ